MRDGKLFLTKVAVEEHAEDVKPAAAAAPAALNYNSLGLAVVELSVDAARRGTAEGGEGRVIEEVAANSGARSGLARGQVIVQVNKVLVASAEGFAARSSSRVRRRGAVLHVHARTETSTS